METEVSVKNLTAREAWLILDALTFWAEKRPRGRYYRGDEVLAQSIKEKLHVTGEGK